MRTKERTEAVLLVDTENVFNVVNQKAFLHNINVICPLIPTLVHKCYSKPLRLFIIGEVKILSQNTTQSDPVTKAVYAIAVIPLILMILEITDQYLHGTSKAAACADDLTEVGTIKEIKYWWEKLCKLGPKFEYYPESTNHC